MTRSISFLLNLALIFKYTDAACADDWPSCRGGTISNIACDMGGICRGKGNCAVLEDDVEFRQVMLDAHNEWRNYLATGKETRGGNSEAADMMALSYDVDLEFTARCNLVNCEMKHDHCRITRRWQSAGQNLFSSSGDGASVTHGCVADWYEECNDTTAEEIDHRSIGTDFVKTGHFTQVVWSKVTHIGCSRATDGQRWFVACNYGPAGNYKGAPVYTRGPACSACPDRTKCNTKYPGLCGEIDESDITAVLIDGHRSGSYFPASEIAESDPTEAPLHGHRFGSYIHASETAESNLTVVQIHDEHKSGNYYHASKTAKSDLTRVQIHEHRSGSYFPAREIAEPDTTEVPLHGHRFSRPLPTSEIDESDSTEVPLHGHRFSRPLPASEIAEPDTTEVPLHGHRFSRPLPASEIDESDSTEVPLHGHRFSRHLPASKIEEPDPTDVPLHGTRFSSSFLASIFLPVLLAFFYCV